jgi:O-antigen ligase
MIAPMAGANLGLRNLGTLGRIGSEAALILAVLVAGGAFSMPLSGLDPHAPIVVDSASVRSEIAIGLAFAVVMLFGLAARERLAALLRQNLLLLALPGLALTSVLWAPEPATALRRALAFAATVVAGIALAAHRPGLAALTLIARIAAAGVVMSLVFVVFSPAYALHQASDAMQNLHAGDWRGVFIHRTVLGQLSALSLALAVHGGPRPYGATAIRFGVILASGVCLAMAHSGGGLVSAGLLLAAPWVLKLCQAMARRGGAAMAVVGMAFGALGLIAPTLVSLALQGLGKDATLTGRTTLWSLTAPAVAGRPWSGYGYSTGFRQVVATLAPVQNAFGYVPNAQNGYLEVVLNLGLAGLLLVLAALGVAAWRAATLALALRTPAEPLATLPFLIVVFIIEMNMIEATLISANDIFVLIYVTAFTALSQISAASAPVFGRSPRRWR